MAKFDGKATPQDWIQQSWARLLKPVVGLVRLLNPSDQKQTLIVRATSEESKYPRSQHRCFHQGLLGILSKAPPGKHDEKIVEVHQSVAIEVTLNR